MNQIVLNLKVTGLTDAQLRDCVADFLLAIGSAGGTVKSAAVDITSISNGIELAADRKAKLQALPQQNPEA